MRRLDTRSTHERDKTILNMDVIVMAVQRPAAQQPLCHGGHS